MNAMPKRLDKYELLERLGHGGMAEVWKALDTQLQRFVAIKLLQPNLREDPNFLTRFQREAQLIAQLHHPNIVQIHDFQAHPLDKADDTTQIAYMVMDYVEGQTLATYIRATSNQGQIPTPTELVNIFTSISLAIDYAHQKGMIHRDIKPANILLDGRNKLVNPMGEPILTDFGVARMLSTSSNTLTGVQLGTPLYIAPEQAMGYPGNERSDLYALGVILYEMTTGSIPFRGETVHEVLMQHINMPPIAPESINPRIPPALAQVIIRSLAKDPAERFSSASALTAAIAEALQLPVPESLGQPGYPPDSSNMPTAIVRPAQTAQASTPSRGSASRADSATPNLTPAMVYMTPIPARTPQQPPPAPPALPSAPSATSRRRKGGFIALIALLLIALLASALGSYLLLFKPLQPPPNPVIGHVYYLSSGQLNSDTAQGIADQIQIDLQNVPPPQSGRSYYAWLLPDRHPDMNPDLIGPRPLTPPILLTNNLPVNNGSVHYFYDGSQTQHNNLIATTSRLLITEEPTGQNTHTPSNNHADWHYYAELPQAQIPNDGPGFSALTHIRHLFYNETNIKVLGLNGGLDFWLSHNTEKIVEWSVSARDDWAANQTNSGQMSLINNLLISILDYLDGSSNVHIDVPAGTPLHVDPLSSRISLLSVVPDQKVAANFDHNPPGYLDHETLHVGQVGKAIDISSQTRQLTIRILNALARAENLLGAVRQDALKLLQIVNDPTQVMQNSTGAMLDDMTTKALYAYLGQVDPSTNQVQPAVLQAHYDVQQLATLTVTSQLPQNL